MLSAKFLLVVFAVLFVFELKGVVGGGGHKGGCMLKRLSFYKDLTEETKEKFREISRNKELTSEEKKEENTRLAQEEFTPEQFTEYQRVVAEHEQQKLQRQEEMDAKIAAMSPNAKVAAQKMKLIMEDESLDWNEKKTQMQAIRAELSEEEQTEVDALKEDHHHGHGHSGRHGQAGRGRRHDGGRGHHGSKGGCMLKKLSFYNDLTEETKEKFKEIGRNTEMTREEKKEEYTRLAQEEFTPEQFTEYQRVVAEHEQQKQQRQADMDAKIAAMSPNAKAAAEKMKLIKEDESLDWDEKKLQMSAIRAELSEDEQTEVDGLREGRHRWHGRGGRHRKNGQRW